MRRKCLCCTVYLLSTPQQTPLRCAGRRTAWIPTTSLSSIRLLRDDLGILRRISCFWHCFPFTCVNNFGRDCVRCPWSVMLKLMLCLFLEENTSDYAVSFCPPLESFWSFPVGLDGDRPFRSEGAFRGRWRPQLPFFARFACRERVSSMCWYRTWRPGLGVVDILRLPWLG